VSIIIRLTIHLSYALIEKCIPYAEEMGLMLAVECHAPHFMHGEWVSRNIEIIQKTGTKNLGIMPDLGTFSKRIPTVVIQDAVRHGAQQHIVDYAMEVYNSRTTPKDFMAKVAEMGGNAADLWLAQRVAIGVWVYHDPKHLLDIMPYVVHIHGKFYEMGEQGVELNIDYGEIIPLLIEGGYKGYIMSEYEGRRLTQGMDVGYDEIEQVRRHQEMLKQLLGEKA
jgi:sugar phosphate isomerase/epimerase